MKKLVWLILSIALVTLSCSEEKEYKYIETIEKPDKEIIETQPKTIKVLNDSLAYCEAYKKYCTSIVVYRGRKELDSIYAVISGIPVSFKLLNKYGMNIAAGYCQIFSDSLHRVLEIEAGYIRP